MINCIVSVLRLLGIFVCVLGLSACMYAVSARVDVSSEGYDDRVFFHDINKILREKDYSFEGRYSRISGEYKEGHIEDAELIGFGYSSDDGLSISVSYELAPQTISLGFSRLVAKKFTDKDDMRIAEILEVLREYFNNDSIELIYT